MKWFYDLKIKRKLLLSFSIVTIIAAFIGYLGYSSIARGKINEDSLYNERTVAIGDLSDANVYLMTVRGDLLAAIDAPNDELRQQYFLRIDDFIPKIDQLVDKYAKTSLSKEEVDALKKYQAGWNDYKPYILQARSLIASKRNQEALELIYGPALQSVKTATESLVSLVDVNQQMASDLDVKLDEESFATQRDMLIVLILGIAASMSMGVFIAKIIENPLKQVIMAIDNADLNSQLHSERKDEIGDLQRSFDKFVESIKSTLLQVAEATSAVASASSEISSSTEQMAAGSQEQTSQAGEVASAVEEMTRTIIENSKNASSTSETAKQAKAAAEQGGQVVDETVSGMKRIADVVRKSSETVQDLGKSSDQIGEIIGVIDDIADQTNLLALNAAIEAARAGEQGRGFAVVADEVRKLAERTTKATKEIATMIKKIQADTKGAVVSMSEGNKQVDAGIVLADKAGDSLKEIVNISQKVTDMVNQIAAASEEQSSASEQISKNVEAISTVTGQTASGTQQIARAAEDLNRLTENLQQLVGKFQLSDTDKAGAPGQTKYSEKSHLQKSSVAVRANGKLIRRDV